MKDYRRSIGVGLISVRTVEDYGIFCEEVSLNRVALITFVVGDSVKNGVSL